MDMKVKVLNFKSYCYTDKKTGELKQGRTLGVMSLEVMKESDGKGNARIGNMIDNIFIPLTFPMEDIELAGYVGEDVELVYQRSLGERYERLADIIPVEPATAK